MDSFRRLFDAFYDTIKPVVFSLTKTDPEKAHELFVWFCRALHKTGLEKLVLDNPANRLNPGFEISNAAGFNKNGEIPPSVLKYLGFERGVIGTVTYDEWKGNPRPRTKRYPETESLVNWMRLPGIGAKEVAQMLYSYGNHGVPLTINVMATPGKKGDGLLRDLEKTVLALRACPYVDRFELNVSCPNTEDSQGGLDARKEYQRQVREMRKVVGENTLIGQELWEKESPDLNETDIDYLLEDADKWVYGLTLTNSTTRHDSSYILVSSGKGGASGDAVYEASKRTQELFYRKIQESGSKLKIIACGGINSTKKIQERISFGARGIQAYTPIIFSGTKLLRELRKIA